MKETSTIGFEYIAEKMHEQQLQLDSALMRSIQETPGMRGEALPYQFRSEWSVTCLLLFCFLLLSYALKNGKKYIFQHLKSLFQHKERSSLFDDTSGSSNGAVVVLSSLTCVFYGLFFFCYSIEKFPSLVFVTPREAIIGMYVFVAFFYVLLKWGSYNFINWIFFEKEQKRRWIQSYFDTLCGQCLLLFPLILLLVYYNLDFHIGSIFMLFILVFAKILLYYKGFRNFFSQSYGFLHLILYFCALEMVPLLLLVKGILYINQIVILNF